MAITETETIQAVVDYIVEGHSRADILDVLRNDGVRESAKIYDQAVRVMAEQNGFPDDPDRAWHIATRRLLYQKNMEINDFKSAHHVLNDIAKLSGLYKTVDREKNLEALSKE